MCSGICMYKCNNNYDQLAVQIPPFQVKLLKDVLQEWKKEVEKKPPEMSVDQAYDTLSLKTGVGGYVFMVSIEFNCG